MTKSKTYGKNYAKTSNLATNGFFVGILWLNDLKLIKLQILAHVTKNLFFQNFIFILSNLFLHTLREGKWPSFEMIKCIHSTNVLWIPKWPRTFFIGHPM